MATATSDSPFSDVLRHTVNEHEYKVLHRYLVQGAPSSLRTRQITPDEYGKICHSHDDYHAATTRSAVRVFLAVGTGLKSWELLSSKLLPRGKATSTAQQKSSAVRSPALRLALSLSAIIYLHRILHRFFLRLRLRLLVEKAAELRKRYPRMLRALTSRYTPAIGASLAGLSLGIYPKDQLRVTLAIYMAARGLEFLYNALDAEGYMRNKPSWLGSWLLFPLAQGQLLHAFLFDRDCFPKAYGDFIMKHSTYYLQQRPPNISTSVPWPGTYEIVDALAEVARLNWPPFVSPIILPKHPSPLPSTIDPKIASITSSAHPILHSQPLSCALIHPSNPSCLHAYLTHMLISTPSLLRVFTLIFSLLSIPRYKSFLKSPLWSLNALCKQILKTTCIISSSIGFAWSSICLFQQILPRQMIPQWRFFLGGFLGGLSAYFDRQGGRSAAIYAGRTSADSLWKVGVKRRWWKGVKGGDVLVFSGALALMGCVLERNKDAPGRGWERWMLEVLKGEKEIGYVGSKEEVGDDANVLREQSAQADTQDVDAAAVNGEGQWEQIAKDP